MQSNFRLVMRSGPTVGKAYPLDKSEMFLGRDLNNEIVINDPEISRRHARLFVQGTSYIIEDLGSTNGTLLNGARLRPHERRVLGEGDTVTVGMVVLSVEPLHAEDIPRAPELERPVG